jgi:hypothetical protein
VEDNRWLGWIGLVVAFAIYQAVRGALRGARGGNNTGMARLNAAAERILKARGSGAATHATSNTTPRTQSLSTKATRSPNAASKPRASGALLPKSTTPAVMRRDGLLSSGKEPVIQRRR